MEDLLAAFMGLDGRYARARLAGSMPHPHLHYSLEGRPDPALHELVSRMLPIWYCTSSLAFFATPMLHNHSA